MEDKTASGKTRRYAVDAQTVADLAWSQATAGKNVRFALDLYRRTGNQSTLIHLKKEQMPFRVGGILQIFRYGEEFDVVDL